MGKAKPEANAPVTGKSVLAAETRRLGRSALLPIALGYGVAVCGLAQAWLLARLVAGLLGYPVGGWLDLAGAAALMLAAAGLTALQEIAQSAAGRAARAHLRGLAFGRLLALGPADPAALGRDVGRWGSYYDHHPVVLAGRLQQVLQQLERRRHAARLM